MERFHGLDATRAIALLLGISLHATCSFIPGFTSWAVVDTQASPAPANIVIVLHIFRMATFFLMAGFFARLAVERKGMAAFSKDRFWRILVPLVAGWLILYPFIAAAYVWGAKLQNSAWLPPAFAAMPIGRAGVFTLVAALTGRIPLQLAHFWFLYYLLFFYLAVLALQPLRKTLAAPMDAAIRVIAGQWWGVLPAAVLLAAILTAGNSQDGAVLDARFGIPNPEHLAPISSTLAAYGMFFLAGWLLHGQPELLDGLRRRYLGYLVLFAVLATAIALAQSAPPPPAVFFTVYALAMWCGVFGVIGACLQWFNAPSRVWRYLSDASYWVYLVHLPAILFLQVAIYKWDLHWALKLLLVHAAVLPPLAISYHLLVRNTAIGALLNGRRKTAVSLET